MVNSFSKDELASLSERKAHVFILGAGFSIPAGQPLTREILSLAAERKETPLPKMIKTLDSYLKDKTLIDRPLIEYDIESLITHLRDNGSWFMRPIFPETISFGDGTLAWDKVTIPLSDYPVAYAHRTLLLIYWALVSNLYEPHPAGGPISDYTWDQDMPGLYREFCASLPSPTTIVTTNYDDILERSLLASNRRWAYGPEIFLPRFTEGFEYLPGTASLYIYDPFVYTNAPLSDSGRPGFQGDLIWARQDWKPTATPAEADVLVCRLHGSFRWIQCRNCSRTYSVDWYAANPVGDFLGYSIPHDPRMTFSCWDTECPWFPLTVAIIPGLEKRFSLNNPVIDGHWQSARLAASRCLSLTVIGSSLRESDEELLAIISSAAARAKQRFVVNPSENAFHLTQNLCGRKFDWFQSIDDLVAHTN